MGGAGESFHAGRDFEVEAGATLDELRLRAAASNPGLRGLWEDWAAQAERPIQVRKLPEPRLQYTEYLRSIETRTGPLERAFGLSQSVPWFGKLGLRGAVEESRADLLWQRFLAAQLTLDHELRRTWADWFYLGRSTDITSENLDLLLRLERVAREKFAAGAENHPDLIRLQVEIGTLEDRLASLVDQRRPLLARLNALLNRPSDAALDFPLELDPPRGLPAPDEIAAWMESQHPRLVALSAEIELAERQRDLARKQYFPDFTVGVQAIVAGEAVQRGTRGSGEDPWTVSLAVELPVHLSAYRAGERQAEAAWRSARKRHQDLALRLAAAVEQALFELRDARRRVDLYGTTLVRKAEEALDSTTTSFQADKSDFDDLIDAERVLLELQLSHERARADGLRAEAALDLHLGRFDPQSTTGPSPSIDAPDTQNPESETAL